MAFKAAVKQILVTVFQVAIILIVISANERFCSCAPSLSFQNDNPKSDNQEKEQHAIPSLKQNKANSPLVPSQSSAEDFGGLQQDHTSSGNKEHNTVLSQFATDEIVTKPEVRLSPSQNEESGSFVEIDPSNDDRWETPSAVPDRHHELPSAAPSKDAVAEALRTLGLSAVARDQVVSVNKWSKAEDESRSELQHNPSKNEPTESAENLVVSFEQGEDSKINPSTVKKSVPAHPINVLQEKLSPFEELKTLFLSKAFDTSSDNENDAPQKEENTPSSSPNELKKISKAKNVDGELEEHTSLLETHQSEDSISPAADSADAPEADSHVGSIPEMHPRARIARVSRMLDDDAIRSYPTRPSSSVLPPFPNSNREAPLTPPGRTPGWNTSDDYWPDDAVLDPNVFPASDRTTDSTRRETRLSSDKEPLNLNGHESSGVRDAKFGDQTVLFDDRKAVKTTGSKSDEEDERNMDGRGQKDDLGEKNMKLTNAHIESSITDRLTLGTVRDDVENLVGNHKNIDATPTLKEKLRVETSAQPLEDASHDAKGSQVQSDNVFHAKNAAVFTYETLRPGIETSRVKEAVSDVEAPEKFDAKMDYKKSSSDVEKSLRPAPSIREDEVQLKNEAVIETKNAETLDSASDTNQNLDILQNKGEISQPAINNSEVFESNRVFQTEHDGKLDSNPDHSGGLPTLLDAFVSEKKFSQSTRKDPLTGNDLPQASGVKVISKPSSATVAPELYENFSNESRTTPDALTLNTANTSTVNFNDTATTEGSSTLQSNDTITYDEDVKTRDISDEKSVEGEDSRSANQSEESDSDKTVEGKQKDSIETYSQFAERVTMEKMNDGNGQSGSAKGGPGASSASSSPRVSAGKKYNNKNYAAPDCGSKLLAANPEAQHASSVIKRDRDDYLLNDCKSKTWFIVELCESIRPSRFEIANFELFSNLPKDVVVYGSQRYPSREWTLLGEYVAEPANRGVQAFPVTTEPFFKYIKVEILSHYGSEYYCPVSLFQVYGVSEFEVIDSMEDGSEEIEEEPVEIAEPKKEEKKERSMFPTVLRSVLYNVLGALNKAPFFSIVSKSNQTPPVDECSTLDPRYKIDEKKCSLAPTINWHLGCYDTEYRYLLKMPLIEQTVQSREFCKTLVDNLCTEKGNKEMIEEDIKEGKHVLSGSQVDLNYACSKEVCGDSYVCVMLCSHHLLALCHIKHFNLSASSSSSNSSVSCEDANIPSNKSVNDKTSRVKASNFVLKDAVIPDKSQLTDLTDKKLKKKEVPSTRVQEDPESPIPLNDNVSDTLKSNKSESDLNLNDGKIEADVEKVQTIAEESVGTEVKKSSPKKEKKVEGSSQDKKTSKNDQKKETSSESKHGNNGARNGDSGGSKNGNGSPLPTVEQDAPAPPKDGNGGNVAAAPVNKESVVVRLSNKIKALEHNLSINSQYLEELSQRYKQQMEEMQLQFSAAVSALNASRPRPSASQEQEPESKMMQEQMIQLQLQMQQLSEMVSQLSVEQETFSSSVVHQHLLLMFVELFLLLTTFWLCMKRQRRQIRDQIYSGTPDELSYTTRDALPGTDRDESPPLRENCVRLRRQNGDQILALQWEKKDEQRILEGKSKQFHEIAHSSSNGLHRSGSVDNSKHKRRKRDRRASMHNLNKAGPFQDLLRDGSCPSAAKRKKRNKTSSKSSTQQPVLFESACSTHLSQKSPSEPVNTPSTDSHQSGSILVDTDSSPKDETVVATSISPVSTSWASKIEGSSLKGTCFDYVSEENKCGANSKVLATTVLSDEIFGSVEDSAIVAEALEIAIKQGRKVSKDTLTRLLLARMSNEKRIKLAKETRREANKRKNLNKSSAGVLFSCEKNSDKKKECPKKDHELSTALEVSSQPCTDSDDKSVTMNDSGIFSTTEGRIRSCLPYLHFPCCPVAEAVNSGHPSNSLVSENHQLMRISECSESSGVLSTSLDTEILSDSSESPLRSVFNRRLSSSDTHSGKVSSSAKLDLELEDLLIAMSNAPQRKILPLTSSLPELKSNIATETKGVSNRSDPDFYASSVTPISNSLLKPVLVNGSRSHVSDTKDSCVKHCTTLANDGTEHTLNSKKDQYEENSTNLIRSSSVQNGNWTEVGSKSSSKAHHAKKKSGHKRTGSDGILSYNGKSNHSREILNTNSNNVIEKKKNRKLKRNMGYGSVGESISSHCDAVVNGGSKSSGGSCSNILSSIKRKSQSLCSTSHLGDENCRSAEDEQQAMLAREEEGER